MGKRKKKKAARFGDKMISKMPLKQVKAARFALEIIEQIADDCTTGKARKRLDKVYKIEGTGFEKVWDAPRLEGISKKTTIGLGTKRKKIKARPNLHPKETEKASDKKERERLLKQRKDARLARKRAERQEVLKLMIEEKK